MRLPLLATLAAVVAMSSPSSAAAPGVGAVAMTGTSFFRPNNGVAVVGSCSYAGFLLTGVAVGATVPLGNNTTTSIVCDLYAGSSVIGSVSATRAGAIAEAGTNVPIDVVAPTHLCGRAEAGTSTWSFPARSAYTCAPVLPGQVSS